MSILILAEDGENTSDVLTQWLLHMTREEVIRINQTDKIDILNVNINNNINSSFTLSINNYKTVYSKDIKAYIYRRGFLSYNSLKSNELVRDKYNMYLHGNLNEYYRSEWIDTIKYIQYLLSNLNIPNVNSLFDADTNKLINLEIAKKFNFDIPATIISNDLNEIVNFINTHNKIITKPIKSPGFIFNESGSFHSYSQKSNIYTLDDFELDYKGDLPFQPTLFQEYIEKDFEIRTFYFNKKFYSMAIFSQSNEKTKIDYRTYDKVNPNRCVPFKLPIYIEKNIEKLMDSINLFSGSIDLIYRHNKYTFLEVNPLGQFDWLSYNCNYYIEKYISEYINNNICLI